MIYEVSQSVPVVEKEAGKGAQIIGLLKNRLSGIVLSRHAYADVLRTIWPDLIDATTNEGTRRPQGVNVWAARPMSRFMLDEMNRRMPGLQIWCVVLESTVLPAGSLEACGNVDQVWVPSRFVRDVCISGGMPREKVHLVPYWLPGPARHARRGGDVFEVLVSWDGRSSMNRKNVLGCVRAFQAAWWRSDTGVRLRLKTRDLSPENRAALVAAIGDDARIVIDERTVESVDEIFDGAGVLLHLHRAEGYGRHIVEAMQRRVPVIATEYSGPCDWMDSGNALAVRYDLVETQQHEFQYPQGGRWARPDLDEAVGALQYARENAGRLEGMLDRAELAAFRWSSLENSRAAMVRALTAGGAF